MDIYLHTLVDQLMMHHGDLHPVDEKYERILVEFKNKLKKEVEK